MMGAAAYRLLENHVPDPGCVVEVGSDRGEGSTAWLADYAERHGLTFYTADVDPLVHEYATTLTSGARLASGADMLATIDEPISVAYLDGFDWIPEGYDSQGWILAQRARYADLGMEMTNANSQAEHLAEAERIAERATPRCVVVMDDTWRTADGWTGKSGRAVPFLEEHGFRVTEDGQPSGNSLGFAVMRR